MVKKHWSLQKPFRDSHAFHPVRIAEREASRSVMKPGYPIHAKAPLGTRWYHLLKGVLGVLGDN